jgi:hypothetical protein
MNGEARASGMVDTGCVDEHDVGKLRESLDGRREHTAFAHREQTRLVRGRYPFGRHRLGEDVVRSTRLPTGPHAAEVTIDAPTRAFRFRSRAPRDRSRPRPIAGVARPRFAPGERHEAPANDGPVRRRPRIGTEGSLGFTGQRVLELHELLGARRPPSGASHDAMMSPVRRTSAAGARGSG